MDNGLFKRILQKAVISLPLDLSLHRQNAQMSAVTKRSLPMMINYDVLRELSGIPTTWQQLMG